MNTEEGDLRTALESAVEAADTPAPPPEPPKTEPPVPPPEPSTPVPGEKPTPVEPLVPEGSAKVVARPLEGDAPPKSWKPAIASKWAAVDSEVKAEINRREREISKVFGETNQIREFHKAFQETIRPYEAHMMAHGRPLDAIANLLRAEFFLSSAPPVQRAQYMAKLVRDYGIDIRELDSALAGEAPSDPVRAQLEQLLEQKLSPLQTFISQQQQLARFQEQRVQSEATSTIETMAGDTAQFPHFEEVREDMADVIEMNARRGVYLTPAQAYDRAVMMNPTWAAEGQRARPVDSQLQQAQVLNDRASKALQASSSVKSLPTSSPAHVAISDDLRGTIEAAFSQVSGR